MAVYTNVTTRLINLPDGSQCIPGQASEVSEEVADNQGFKDLVDSGDIVAGEVAPDKLEEVRAERQAKQFEQASNPQAQQQQPQARPQQQQPTPTPQPTSKDKSS